MSAIPTQANTATAQKTSESDALNARAEAAAKARLDSIKQRKAAPDGIRANIERMDLLKQTARQVITDPGKHPYWAKTEKLQQAVGRGYRVATWPNGTPVTHEELTLTWIEQEIFQDGIERVGRESRERLRSGRELAGEIDKDAEAKRNTGEELKVTVGGKANG